MPQHAKRVKIRRKDLRQPDEFETLTGRALDWAEHNRPTLVAAIVAVLVIAAGTIMVGRLRVSRNLSAHEEFRSAHALYDAGRFSEAEAAFIQLASGYPSTPMGQIATLYRAHALARGGDPDGASTAYSEYLASGPEAIYLRQEALLGLGQTRETQEDTEGALQAYSDAASLEGPFQQEALLAEARLNEVSGQHDRAKEIYTRLLAEVPQGDLRALLISKLPPGADIPPPEQNPDSGAQGAGKADLGANVR